MENKLTGNADSIPENAPGGGTRTEGSFEGETADGG